MGTDQSPCTRLCLMDQASRHCIGCWRMLDEITCRSQYSSTQKLTVLAQLEMRHIAMNTPQ